MKYFDSPGFRKYFANTSWLLAERVFRLAVNLFVGIYVARYLGPQQFGILSYALSFVSIFSAFALLGLDTIIVRELVKEEGHRDEILGTACCLKLFGALVVLLMITLVLPFIDVTQREMALVYVITVGLLFQSVNVIDFFFQAKVQSRYVVKAQVVQVALSAAVKLLLVWNDAPLLWFGIVIAADHFVLGVGLISMYSKSGRTVFRWCYRWMLAKKLLREAWPLIFSALAVSVYMQIDQVMIKIMLDAEAVGNYAAAVRISEAWYFIPIAITASLFPAIVKAKEVEEYHYRQKLQKLGDLMVWLAVGVALPITFIADWLVKLLFGAEFHSAGPVLSIHVWAGVFVFIGCVVGRSFVADNNQILNLYRNVAGMLVNIGLNLLLIPEWGINGAAIATIISYAVSSYFVIVIFKSGRANFILVTKSLCFAHLFARKREEGLG